MAGSQSQGFNTRAWLIGAIVVVIAVTIVFTVMPTKSADTTTNGQVVGAATVDGPLSGATVALSNGAKSTTSAAGNFVLETSFPKAFTVTVTGGTTAGQLSGVTLAADYEQFDPKVDEVNVDILTTIVSRYHQSHSGVSVAEANERLRTALALPADLDLSLDQSFLDPTFSAHRFLTAATQAGGFDKLVDKTLVGMENNQRVGAYPAAVKNPAQTSAASFIAGKLLEGAGGQIGSAVIGNLMSQAGLDPQTNALQSINTQLVQLSAQISTLQTTANKTLSSVLETSFNTRLDALPITSIRDAQSDLVRYTKESDPAMRQAYVDHFKAIAGPANLNLVVDRFNDLLNPASPGTLTVIQHFAQKLVGAGRFYTPAAQVETDRVFDFLDGMQVAADNLYIEYLNLTDPTHAPGIAKIEVEQLRSQRAAQIARNPEFSGRYDRNGYTRGALDVKQKIWLRDDAEPQADGLEGVYAVQRSLATQEQLENLAADRGDKTLKQYLAVDAGLTRAMQHVPDYGVTGEFWTATKCGRLPEWCRHTVSTNNGYVRHHYFSPNPVGDKLYVLSVSPLTPAEQSRYKFFW